MHSVIITVITVIIIVIITLVIVLLFILIILILTTIPNMFIIQTLQIRHAFKKLRATFVANTVILLILLFTIIFS